MKKILIIITMILAFITTGCNTGLVMDSPTKTVENFFNKYQTLDEEVLKQLNDTIDSNPSLVENLKDEYRDLMKKHYQNLKYEIKDEIVDGNQATVTVEIEVYDYTKVMENTKRYKEENISEFNGEDGKYDEILFTKYRLDKLKNVNDTVKYTLDLTLTKIDDKWQLDSLGDVDEQKINGIYKY